MTRLLQTLLVLVIGLCGVLSTAVAGPPDSLASVGLLPARAVGVALAASPIPRLANPHGDISIPCEACHTPDAWTPLREDIDFDHSEQTRFAMTGKHTLAECASCHLELRFDQPDLTADECASCHLDVHRGQLGDECQMCHNTQDFQLTNGALIHAQTSFPLTGSHLQVSCETCHTDAIDGLFAPLDTDCFACHAVDYQTAASIDHVAAGFSTECEQCHSTLAFSAAGGFNHVIVSEGFALVGTHAEISCESCHTVPGFEPIFDAAGQDDCYACHQADYERTTSIDHVAAGFPTECAPCHSVTAWENATFEHVAVSGGFALVGAHVSLPCSSCHVGPDFDVPTDPAGQNDCFACHAAEHEDEHPGFPTDCLQCHTVNTWEDADFEHTAVADGFALVGAHAMLDCASCHIGPDFETIFDPDGQNDCFACHAEEHEDEHPSFPTNCLECHTVNTWDDADFNHVIVSEGFALVGAHTTLECAACHVGPDFEPIFDASGQNDCFACHAEDHEDEHPGFPTECLQCHTVDTWDDADFDHAAASEGFALIGAHATLDCASCHIGPDFEPIFDADGQNDCFTCHAPEHEEEHPAFPTDCLQCHNVNTWDGAVFNHNTATDFDLVGAHVSLPCSSCHVGPDFDLIFEPSGQNDCFACHAEEHQDEHPSFPTNCLQCHTVDTWDDADFDHDPFFPIYSGRHEGEWDSCQTCHNQGTFATFTCLVCHEHSRDEMDDEHDDVGGYVYESNACLDCHPDGEDRGGTFK
jgi:mRNA-degrading endonuclease YafQ of YafQ-DinJ toxin-antitoxin module